MQPIKAPSTVTVECVAGFPAEIDALAARGPVDRGFLRAAWFAAATGDDGRTLIARRDDGSPLLAIPTAPAGPALVGMRAVPGSYWPFRSILIAPDATAEELVAALRHPVAGDMLMPMWRLGPVYADDPAVPKVKAAAGRAGWTVLTRRVGHSFTFDLAAAADDGWPRKSTRRRLAGYERQLAEHGPVAVRHLHGAAWDDAVLDTLGAIEANSWIARTTDGSGAKFLTAAQRDLWRRALADPALAGSLSATILSVGDAAIAFSFDLRAGDRQYAIASSYDDAWAAFRPGRIVTFHQFGQAHAQGVRTIDLGTGDSGYKREMGARAGCEILDLLVVRSRPAASLLRIRWGEESRIGRAGFLEGAGERRRFGDRIEPWLAAGAMAAAALTLAE
ncbi:GNAT family N-acetyltransferase [Sphingomonas sp.]|uniref:GNAT family N-acetyltransferase n=1 Tax=Sphingomonas sp. TaxID=28214 RepID=UPI002DD63572|nr:GNAT family N-acetyltransferase [Sphingomonas sp.]